MNRNDYMSALRGALSVLPDEERASALRYYEEYFDDAGPENEQKVIEDLGAPEMVAAQILADYRELTAAPAQSGAAGGSAAPRRGWRGINPWLLALLVLLAIPIGIPLAAALGGVLISVLAVLAAAVLVVVVLVAVVPFVLLVGGVAFIVCSCFVWWHPASALVTLGCGLALLALGALAAMLMIKLCTLFLPPIFRGFVAILRWPFDRIRGVKK
ncbi:MAG: DUF1700 domain-containing protein [Eubacteriales bacterium]|nr:DUF1700 domain-containing protein [Eubacteriales bacterium]